MMAERKEDIDKVLVTMRGSSLSLSLISSKLGWKLFSFFFKQTFLRFHSLSKDIPNSFFHYPNSHLTSSSYCSKKGFLYIHRQNPFSTLSYAQEAHVQ